MARAKEEKGDFLKRGKLWLNAFLNPFFSFSARKKRTVSAFQEKKEGWCEPLS